MHRAGRTGSNLWRKTILCYHNMLVLGYLWKKTAVLFHFHVATLFSGVLACDLLWWAVDAVVCVCGDISVPVSRCVRQKGAHLAEQSLQYYPSGLQSQQGSFSWQREWGGNIQTLIQNPKFNVPSYIYRRNQTSQTVLMTSLPVWGRSWGFFTRFLF